MPVETPEVRGQRSDCRLDARKAEGAQTIAGSSGSLQGNCFKSMTSGPGGLKDSKGLGGLGDQGDPGAPGGTGPVTSYLFDWFPWTQKPGEPLAPGGTGDP